MKREIAASRINPPRGSETPIHVADPDLIVQLCRAAAPGRLALDGHAIAFVVGGVVAQRIGSNHPAGQTQIDMRAGAKGRQFPAVGIDQ